MENLMIQWVEEAGTFRGDKEAPRLALIFYKEPEVLEIVKYEIQEPIREEWHVVIEFIVKQEMKDWRREEQRKSRLKYSKPNFKWRKGHFEMVDWSELTK